MAVAERAKTNVIHSLNELRATMVDNQQAAEALQKQADDQGRDLTAEEEADFNHYVELAQQAHDQLQAELAEDKRAARRAALVDMGTRFKQAPDPAQELTRGPLAHVQFMRERWEDDPKRGYRHAGLFFQDVWASGMPGMGASDLLQRIQAAATGMNQSQGSMGGFAVPPMFSTEIYDGFAASPDNLMTLCDMYVVTGESLTFPRNPETSRVNGSRYGGVRGYWIAEGDQITSSNPKLGQCKLEPQELAVLVYATDKLLRNAPALDAYIRRSAGEEIMFLVNNAIIRGTGAGQPLGILTAGAKVEVAKETNQPADTIELENVNNMVMRLHPRAEAGAVWFRNKDTEAQLEQLSAVVGTGGLPVFLASPGGFPTVAERRQERLKGFPVRSIEYCSTLGDAGDLILANLGYYALGIQGSESGQGVVQEAMSMHLRFDYAETAF